MKHRLIAIVMAVMQLSTTYAQRYTAKEGVVDFYSHAPLEDIKADNRKVQSLFNAGTNEIAFRIRISDFKFPKQLMQEHFNEKYMESEKYPYATFSGLISGFSIDAEGWQDVSAEGELQIHGVKRTVTIPGRIRKKDDNLEMKSEFMVRLEDHHITIPQILWKNIAEEIKVTLSIIYKKS